VARQSRAPPPEQNPIRVPRTYWEIWSIVNGRRGAHPICAPSLVKAQEEAAYLERGNLLADGHRAPSRPIFELELGESLDDIVAGDGLYITRRTVDGSASLNF